MTTVRCKTWLLAALLIVAAAAPGRAQDGPARITDRLARALAAQDKAAGAPVTIWVRFADKEVAAAEMPAALAAAAAELAPGVLARRGKAGAAIDASDLPLSPRYLAAVAATGAVPRRQSRWLNAASWQATATQVEAIARLPFVAVLDLVGGTASTRPPVSEEMPAELQAALAALQADKSPTALEYGGSLPALQQVNLPAVHAMGLTGKGVTVAMLDTGFDLTHESFAQLDVVATWDFIHGDENVGQRPREDIYQTFYGTAALSLLAGYSSSNLVGSASGVSVILAKTEDLSSETPAEEDNWIAAVEWAESLGADVISSGVGYIEWYDFADLDGRTAAITVAAEMAAARGVCVVTSAGNERANSGWPHIIAPADAAGVIAVGACDINNQVTYFSSPGPTADGRIKPDLLAPGQGVPAAYYLRPDMYSYVDGSNYATPIVAGIVALMLEHDPGLNPARVAADLRAAASRAALPDNDFGWGIPDALAAVNARTPVIAHTPLRDREGNTGAYAVNATITADAGIDGAHTWVAWRVNGGDWKLAAMSNAGGDAWTGLIPPQVAGRTVDYYLVATSLDGDAAREPATAPAEHHTFRVGQDTTGPAVDHFGLGDQVPATWPPVVRAQVTDNLGVAEVNLVYSINGGASQGPFAMTRVGDEYELAFPLPGAAAQPGLQLSYLIIARDTATIPNFTSSGPYEFGIVASRGRVLLVDDRSNTKSAPPAGRGSSGADAADKSALDLANWITDAGFTVDVINAVDVGSGSFLGYDAVMVSCGGNYFPLSFSELRRTMAAWAEAGGRILVEGGEVAYAVDITPGYPEIKGPVLHMASYGGENGVNLRFPAELDRHPLANRPHRLPNPLVVDNSAGMDYSAADVADAADDAFVAMRIGEGSLRGGVIIHDDNTGPDAGQTVYFPFNLLRTVEAEGRALLDNTLSYLTADEGPGTAAMSGQVGLAGRTDYSGVTIDCGRGRTTTTAADGSWTLAGLWGGSYTVTVSAPGFAPQTRLLDLVDGLESAGNDFFLLPVVEENLTAAPGVAIPDNNPSGVASEIVVAAGGTLQGITVDGNISHFSIGQLVVTLTSPAGTTVTLHNRTGGTADNLVGRWPGSLFVDGPGSLEDFLGENPQGAWTLHVVDQQFGASGTFNTWGLNLLTTPADAAAVGDDGPPAATRLVGNAPNPFNPRTVVAFELARGGTVRLDVYDLRGRLVRRLADGVFAAGLHTATWDGRDDAGAEPASGLYFCRLHTDQGVQVHKMTLLR